MIAPLDDFNTRSIKLTNLHWKTSKGEVSRHFPKAASINLLTKDKNGRLDRRQPGIAIVSFGTDQEALSAVDEKQGCVIHGRKVSVMFSNKRAKG